MTELTIDIAGARLLPLQEQHLDEIIALMNREGWYYYDHQELRRYLQLNQDCYVLAIDETIAGSVFTTNYARQIWIGNIVIAEKFRGRGFAAKMIGTVIDKLDADHHHPTFRLGAVPLAIGLYKKVGFHAEAFTTSQYADLPLQIEPETELLAGHITLKEIQSGDLAAIAELDARYFKSNRLQLLQNIYHDSIKECCLCLKEGAEIVGFLMLRRRAASKEEAGFARGPDYVYRLGPCAVLPEYGINGFKALFQQAIIAVNEQLNREQGSARIYIVFPKNADKQDIYADTRALAQAMDLNTQMNLDAVFDEHEHIFATPKSAKNEAQWNYLASLGFHQEYFEQVMVYKTEEDLNKQADQIATDKADPEGIFASATPGDKG